MLATSPKPESSRNYVGLVKALASLARQSEPPPSMHCTFATWQQNDSLEMWGASEKFAADTDTDVGHGVNASTIPTPILFKLFIRGDKINVSFQNV